MTKASDNPFPSILVTEGTEPAAPAAGKQRVYIDSTSHHLSRTDSSGTQVDIEAIASSSLASDTLWDAAGDLVQGTGANAAAKLSLGAAGTVVRSTGSTNAYAYPPGYEFDYAQKTTDTSITNTTEGTADTIVTGNAVTYDGATIVEIEAFAGWQPPNVSAGSMTIWLYDGAGSIGAMGTFINPGTLAAAITGMRVPAKLSVRITPSNAAHTYSIRASVASGTGTVKAGAGGNAALYPAYIRITKV